MAPSIPTREPDVLEQGVTAKWHRTLDDFSPSDGWVVTYSFRGPATLDLPTTATPAGGYFAAVLSAADSETLTPGRYEWSCYAALNGETYRADAGVLVVLPSLAAAGAGDRVLHAETMLAAIEAEIAARITGNGSAHVGYTIAGRQIQKLELRELQSLRTRYRYEVRRLRNPTESTPNRRAVFRVAQ